MEGNRDAEYAVIGLAMLDTAIADRVALLPEDAFTFDATKRLHRGIQGLRRENKAVDMITLCDRVSGSDFAPEADAIEASQHGFAPSMYREYETILLNERARRTAASVGNALLTGVASGQDIRSVVDSAVQRLTEADKTDENVSMRDALFRFVDGLNTNSRRVPTGIADVDAVTGGLSGGQLVIIGARPGVGKSALVINMMLNAAQKGFAALMVSLEMSPEEIVARMVARESDVDSMNIARRALTDEECVRMAGSYESLHRLKIEINCHANTPMQIRRAATAMKNSVGLDFIVVDYMQLMNPDRKTGSRYEAISDISRALKTMAMELNVPIIALAQLNRGSEVSEYGKVVQRMPTLADFRDSGSIEQDANMAMLLWCPPEPDASSPLYDAYRVCQAKGYALVQVNFAKNRAGRTGVFNLAFDKAKMRFVSIGGG